ncbi:MAG TPA: DUF4124 domain-containing protein [Methylophilaceae bacterium]|nr:DUF4124 domain-containing protein [Methylophilaceae bacterium]
MKKILLISGLVVASFSLTAHAAIYKCVGDSGIPAFVDGKTKTEGNYKNCVLFIRDDSASGRSNTSGGSKAGRQSQTKTATPADFPRVDRQTQDQRDGKRKEILQQELEAERKALEDAKKAYAEGESNPEMFTSANGKRFRNVPKFQEKMQKLQADVDAHEKNIELLQKELDSIK